MNSSVSIWLEKIHNKWESYLNYSCPLSCLNFEIKFNFFFEVMCDLTFYLEYTV